MFTTRIRRLRQELTTLWPRREEITSDVASSITDSVLTAAFNDSTMSSSVCASDATDSAMTTQDTNNNDDDDDDDSNVDYARLVLVTILFCIVVFTAVGNFIVLISPLYERRLRTTLIYFILNLALTDFLVSIMAMDFYTIEVLLGYWPFGEIICAFWIFFDYALTFASVFTLLVISLDRFWSVQWPIQYKIRNTKTKCIIAISAVWLSVLVIWLPPCIQDRLKNSEPDQCIWDPSLNKEFVIVIAILGHHGPCFTIIFCYVRVFLAMRQRFARVGDRAGGDGDKGGSTIQRMRAQASSVAPSMDDRSMMETSAVPTSAVITGNGRLGAQLPVPGKAESDQSKQQRRREDRERRSFILLSYVIGTYLVCWVPFHVVFDISAVSPESVSDLTYRCVFWLCYVNSALNPILYAYSSQDFRNAFKKIVKCQVKRVKSWS